MIPPSNSVATFRSRIAAGLRDDGQIDHWDIAWAARAVVNDDDTELDAVEAGAIRQMIRSDRFQAAATPQAVALAYSLIGENPPAPPAPAPAPANLGWSAQ